MGMAKFLAWKLLTETAFIEPSSIEGGGNASKEEE
jgi:hypothetical protein